MTTYAKQNSKEHEHDPHFCLFHPLTFLKFLYYLCKYFHSDGALWCNLCPSLALFYIRNQVRDLVLAKGLLIEDITSLVVETKAMPDIL